ncbi:MAG TPA: choice-of-anchor B family protein, partial [Rubricoccaceae bacterium]|nr:choice-of-anchor B family protein [Rubricoccaceae bacterium]
MRVFLLTALALATAPAFAQGAVVRPCIGGIADEDGNPSTTNNNYPCNGVDLYAHLPINTFASPGSPAPTVDNSELWGWTDPETGKEYALVALYNGTAFVDVSTPEAPVYLGKLPQPAGVSPSLWRTLRVYNNHVFVGSEANSHGVQVFDLTQLRNVTTPPITFAQSARYTGVGRTHTLEINTATGFMYLAGTNTCSGGLHIVNVQNPVTPVQAGCFSADGYTHEAQCLVYDGPDADHAGKEICAAYNEDHVAFVDVTNKANPTLISRGFYPNTGYTHQGWFTDDRRHILLDDEFDPANPGTRTIVMSVADLDAPTFDFNYFGP